MLKRIVCENFMQLENEEIILYEGNKNRGRIQITGGVHAGKTRVLEAICFGLGGVDRNGDQRPSHLISLSQREALVRLVVDGKKQIERTIDRKLRKISVTVTQGNAEVALNNSQFIPIIGLSPLAAVSACVAGLYAKFPTHKRVRIFDEVFPLGVDLGEAFRIQRGFSCRIMCGACPYEEAEYQVQREFDLLLCYAIHKAVRNDLGFVIVDDVDYLKWNDTLNPPAGIQLITTRYVLRAPLEIRGV